MPVLGQKVFIFAPTTDKFISLAGEEFTRRLDLTGYGNNWSKIRIGLNYQIDNTGGGNISGSLYVGLCSGTTFPLGSAQCTNAAFHYWGSQITAGTFTFNAGAGNPFYTANSAGAVRRVGVTDTAAAVGSATWNLPATGGTLERRGWLGVTIQQTATQAIITGFTQAAAVSTLDTWYEHFLYCTNQGGTPSVNETAAAVLAQTLTPGAGWNNNNLDTLDILWTNTTSRLLIYAVACEFTP